MWIATEINQHHDSFIKEAFSRQLAANKRKIFWDLNPDNPNAPIYTEYIDKDAERAEKGLLIGGYNYKHFTIDDNATITKERIEEIKSMYDPNSIWYRRDILGMRCVADGLIYRQIAEHTEDFLIDEPPSDIKYATIGVDFGGNKSAHSFKLTGYTQGFKQIITLDEYYKKQSLS